MPVRALLDLRGDNYTVISWLAGLSRATSHGYARRVASLQDELHRQWAAALFLSAEPGGHLATHIFREGNKLADAEATRALSTKRHVEQQLPRLWTAPTPWKLQGLFDGGSRNGHYGCGYVLRCWRDDLAMPEWEILAKGSFYIGQHTTVTNAELTGCEKLVNLICKVLRCNSKLELAHLTM